MKKVRKKKYITMKIQKVYLLWVDEEYQTGNSKEKEENNRCLDCFPIDSFIDYKITSCKSYKHR